MYSRSFRRCLFAPALIALLGVGFVSLAHGAGPIVDSGGFEGFTLSSLAPQQGWLETPGPGTAVVQSSVVLSGSRAVQVDRAASSDKRWADLVTGFPTGRFVLIDWDMRVAATGAEGQVGPFFGVEAYDDLNNVSASNPPDPYGPALIGSLGVDATTGEVFYQAAGTGTLTLSNKEVVFDQWHHFRMVLDFNLHQYTSFFDGQKVLPKSGTQVGAIGFVDQGQVVGGLNDFTDADIAALAAALESPAMTGTAYVDNFRVWNGIPGDFVVDGVVNTSDFNAWKTAFGPGSAADADGDLDSDGRDFLAWQREFGFNLAASTPVASPAPEPTSAFLVAAAAVAGLWGRRPKRCPAWPS